MKGILLGLAAAAIIAFSTTPAMARRYRVVYPAPVYRVYRTVPVRAYYPRRVYVPAVPVYPVYPVPTVVYGY